MSQANMNFQHMFSISTKQKSHPNGWPFCLVEAASLE
jgi:hypothetical protein